MRHENSSNDLQTTCSTLEIQLKELRAENHAKEIQITKLNALIKKDNGSKAEDGAEVKELRAHVAALMTELESRRVEAKQSFTRMLDEVTSKKLENDKDEELSVPSDRGDSDKIDVKLMKKMVSLKLFKKIFQRLPIVTGFLFNRMPMPERLMISRSRTKTSMKPKRSVVKLTSHTELVV